MEKPVAKKYVPLVKSQRLETGLEGPADTATTALAQRNARVAHETLTVETNAAADAKVAAATAAYDARQKIYDANPSLKVLDNKAIIPAGGYLVLVADAGKAGVADPKVKNLDKKTAAQKLYNKIGLGLPFPANDLSNFFRNGGTLNVAYQDITAATGSGHDDSKGPTGDDATNYTAASTNAYAAGAVIISEIMWGLDRGTTEAQYVELHNTTAAAIGIDNKEWVIAVGDAPAGFTVIDTAGNNPATGYWQVPGTDGASTVQPNEGFFTLVDIVSMSRVTDGTDGTAAASWAASMRPSANIGGRRIGSPGAANVYAMPAAEADPETEPVTPAAAVAKAGDLVISEIMVASDDGRLPQWIEIANVSATAVSLSGWSLEIENDSADADVVGEGDTIVIDLGAVEIGADQVALVISKESARNSGVGTGDGDLRADRIIDVQSAVSPTNARYSLISEMGFMLSLIPPPYGCCENAR